MSADPANPDPVEEAVRAALSHSPTTSDVVDLVTDHDAVASAELVEGLVKTFPPQVELLVHPADNGGPRTFDLVEELDGRLSFGGEHPQDDPGDAPGTPR